MHAFSEMHIYLQIVVRFACINGNILVSLAVLSQTRFKEGKVNTMMQLKKIRLCQKLDSTVHDSVTEIAAIVVITTMIVLAKINCKQCGHYFAQFVPLCEASLVSAVDCVDLSDENKKSIIILF